MSPLTFSIITPSLNQAEFLGENIQSVRAQQYPHIEHIVVDGGSTDGTLAILQNTPGLRWISEHDSGQSEALNKGFRMAQGEIIGWINSDDGYCNNVLPEVARCFNDPSVMVVYGNGVEVDRAGAAIRTIVPRGISTEDLVEYWKWRYEYVQASFFFRRSVFELLGYLDEDLFYTMDHDFFIRLSGRFEFQYLPRTLAYYRLHESSKTGSTYQNLIPRYMWELHKVSMRYWGTPLQWRWYRHGVSFLGGILASFVKNIFFVPGSKSRTHLGRLRRRSAR